ncbi:MAG TPA: CPBP family intramembrane glutamic endopeptidase [Terriglobales bacterium]|nr:CPBP family intramembrane glutamic endopeptidase [Terriglobales bacterium]
MPSSDPAWNAWDLLGLIAVGIVAIVVSTVVVLLAAKQLFYPHADVASLSRNAIVIVAGQALGYLLVFAYMYAIVTRVRRRPDFLAAIHWNLPRNPAIYLAAGVLLSIGLQVFAHFLPIPKNLPIDTLFRTSAEAWMLTIFGITLAPLMEELFFRGFLYPVLEHYLGFAIAVPFTALGFALLHGSQLKFAWGPLLVIFIVGLVLTIVRARKKSVAASLLIHVGYNTTLSGLIFVATGGFRHLEKLKQ